MDLKRGIDKAVDAVITDLKKQSEVIGNDFKNSASGGISANTDEEIGTLIADAMKRVTKDGVITVEEAKVLTPMLMKLWVCNLTEGYLSPYFITNTENMTTEYDNC